MLQLNDIKKRVAYKPAPIKQKQKQVNINQAIKYNKEKTWDFFIRYGNVNGNVINRNSDNIHNVWQNEPCYIVGGGPALKEFIDQIGWDWLRGRHTIGINHMIEDFDDLEWFFFLDKRFLDKTTYDIKKFKGRIFAQSNTGLQQSDQVTLFHCNPESPQTEFNKGLYSPNYSGLAALNLALLTGANPIYLLGYGMGSGAYHENYHYKRNYTGEVKTEKVFNKFVKVQRYYKQFAPYVDKIIHVTQGRDIPIFKKMTIPEFKKKNTLKVSGRLPKIVHYSFSADINIHADITRELIKKGYGNHILKNINDKTIPAADIYIMEHFISTNQKVNQFPYKQKAINIVHSQNCLPVGNWGKVVCLTNAWERLLKKHLVKNTVVIRGGIDVDKYTGIEPDYSKRIFGRITKWSPGKIHPEWNRIVKEILEEIQDAECLFYTQLDYVKGRTPLSHPRMIYNNSVKINDFKGDYLKNMSLYVHANGYFKETMSHAVIEAMATGLPVIYLAEPTGVIEEVTGDAGIKCKTIQEVKQNVINFLKAENLRRELGKIAKERAKQFQVKNWVAGMDKLIKEMLK